MTDSTPPSERTDGRLQRDDLDDDPIEAFRTWLRDAENRSRLEYPNSCVLSTVDPDGMPEGRVVLLKGLDPRGFIFYTNYQSNKGRSLASTPRAALTFYWDAMGRQVRVRGPVERVTDEESDRYFDRRPRESQLGAWASDQSRPIADREALEDHLTAARERFGSGPVPRPPHWGGFLIRPVEIEFWSAGEARLHDRIVFRRGGPDGNWSTLRLSP